MTVGLEHCIFTVRTKQINTVFIFLHLRIHVVLASLAMKFISVVGKKILSHKISWCKIVKIGLKLPLVEVSYLNYPYNQ